MGMNRGKALPRVKKAARAAKKPKVVKAKAVAVRAKPRPKPPKPRITAKPAAPPADQAMRDLAKRIVDLTEAGNDEASLALYADTIESRWGWSPPSASTRSARSS